MVATGGRRQGGRRKPAGADDRLFGATAREDVQSCTGAGRFDIALCGSVAAALLSDIVAAFVLQWLCRRTSLWTLQSDATFLGKRSIQGAGSRAGRGRSADDGTVLGDPALAATLVGGGLGADG